MFGAQQSGQEDQEWKDRVKVEVCLKSLDLEGEE